MYIKLSVTVSIATVCYGPRKTVAMETVIDNWI